MATAIGVDENFIRILSSYGDEEAVTETGAEWWLPGVGEEAQAECARAHKRAA